MEKQKNIPKTIPLPKTLIQRVENRKVQIAQLKDKMAQLENLNQESFTAFLEGQVIPPDMIIEYDEVGKCILLSSKPKN